MGNGGGCLWCFEGGVGIIGKEQLVVVVGEEWDWRHRCSHHERSLGVMLWVRFFIFFSCMRAESWEFREGYALA